MQNPGWLRARAQACGKSLASDTATPGQFIFDGTDQGFTHQGVVITNQAGLHCVLNSM